LTDELRVDGRVTVYRLHDIGYAIALDRAAELLGAGPTSRVRPERLEARAIEIRNPPISVPLRSLDLTLDRGICPATVSAHLFDFGVCSLQVQVQAPSALSATVSGRVTTSGWRGVGYAKVVITDGNVTQTVYTNSFGFFTFSNLPTGANYTISVSKKRYTFSPQQMALNDNIANVTFINGQ